MKNSTKLFGRRIGIGVSALLTLGLAMSAWADLPTAPPPRVPLPAAAVGWGNLLVPGLGATLREHPWQGLTEAALEIGSFYGGTLLAPEGRFRIDGSIDIPETGSIKRPVTAQILQQFGLKFHFYNTFYHYQQTVIENADTEREKNNPQPIYVGTWRDMAAAPFKLENLTSTWSWPVILGGLAYLTYDYAHSTVPRLRGPFSPIDESMLAFTQTAAVPFGSSFGEDVLFRGFIQREMLGMTRSLPAAIGTQSVLFAFLHQNRLNSFLVGTYFGIETYQLKGQLGPVMAAHFWLDLVDGLFTYLSIRRSHGKFTPLTPPIATQLQIPF